MIAKGFVLCIHHIDVGVLEKGFHFQCSDECVSILAACLVEKLLLFDTKELRETVTNFFPSWERLVLLNLFV
jgi:hypothetical protein